MVQSCVRRRSAHRTCPSHGHVDVSVILAFAQHCTVEVSTAEGQHRRWRCVHNLILSQLHNSNLKCVYFNSYPCGSYNSSQNRNRSEGEWLTSARGPHDGRMTEVALPACAHRARDALPPRQYSIFLLSRCLKRSRSTPRV